MPAFQRVSFSRHIFMAWEFIGLKLLRARSLFMTIVRLFAPLRRVLYWPENSCDVWWWGKVFYAQDWELNTDDSFQIELVWVNKPCHVAIDVATDYPTQKAPWTMGKLLFFLVCACLVRRCWLLRHCRCRIAIIHFVQLRSYRLFFPGLISA